jgi:hypothetical protein
MWAEIVIRVIGLAVIWLLRQPWELIAQLIAHTG